MNDTNWYRQALEAITADPRYLAHIDWGEPRPGHPEGSVRAHIAELEENLSRLRTRLSDEEFWKLRLLIHTHDMFKGAARPGAAIADPDSHASLARQFLTSFCDDADLLAIVQFHDEPFALYRQYQLKGRYRRERLERLLQAIQDWDLFLAFVLTDGCTAGKSREPLAWFFRELEGRVASRFSAADILD